RRRAGDGGEGLLVGADGLAGVGIDLGEVRDARVVAAEVHPAPVDQELPAGVVEAGGVVSDGAEVVRAGDERARAPEGAHAAVGVIKAGGVRDGRDERGERGDADRGERGEGSGHWGRFWMMV